MTEQPRLYQNHHFDSTRWRWFESRPDDIVIATSYKAGTTWTQAIVANLLFPGGDFPDDIGRMSPWLDLRTVLPEQDDEVTAAVRAALRTGREPQG